MTSVVQIANEALQLIGETSIYSLDSESTQAQEVKLVWPSVRDDVLRSYAWNCATKRAKLIRLSETPSYGYKYSYQLPSDYMQLIEEENDSEFIREQDKLITNSDSISIKYIYRESDTTKYDPNLVKVMVYSLAVRLAHTITGSVSLSERLEQRLEVYYRRAMSADAKENKTRKAKRSRWLNSRMRNA